jgi:hypothetical protein
MKNVLMNQCPRGSFQPNVGIVEVPDPRQQRARQAAIGKAIKTLPNGKVLSSFCPGE